MIYMTCSDADGSTYLVNKHHIYRLTSYLILFLFICVSIWYIGKHYENKPIQIYWKFYHQKNESFQMKNSNFFHISAQNIDCGYSLEPPRRGDEAVLTSTHNLCFGQK